MTTQRLIDRTKEAARQPPLMYSKKKDDDRIIRGVSQKARRAVSKLSADIRTGEFREDRTHFKVSTHR